MLSKKFVRVTKFLLAGMTVSCVSWLVSVNEWHSGEREWISPRVSRSGPLPTIETIVAYSEGKQAELDKPSPVTCDRLPAFPKIPDINRTWHPGVTSESTWQAVPGTSVMLYAAYYDERMPQKYVRILAKFSGRNISKEGPIFCQTRPLNAADLVEVVAAKPTNIWHPVWDKDTPKVKTPLLLSCPLTDSLEGPSVVSVVTQPCDDPTNGFLLKPLRRKINRTFTVCVKDMNFNHDISQQLVEWVETNRILGADMIDVYVDEVSKDTEKVLLYYRDQGYIRLFKVPTTHQEGRILWQRRRDHLITYNDCLYRNIVESEYIVPLDVDEIILPKISDDWKSLVKHLKQQMPPKKAYSALVVSNVFFFDFMQNFQVLNNVSQNKIYTKRDDVRLVRDWYDRDVNKEFYDKYKERCGTAMAVPKLARHVIRSAAPPLPSYYTKSMMMTNKVLTVFNHYPLASIGSNKFWNVPIEEVQLNHYKEWCNQNLLAECDLYKKSGRVDHSALRLRSKLEAALASAICVPNNNT